MMILKVAVLTLVCAVTWFSFLLRNILERLDQLDDSYTLVESSSDLGSWDTSYS
jgi:hypothetical protein